MAPLDSSKEAIDALGDGRGVFKLLAADHRGSFVPLLDPGEDVVEAKRDIVGELGPFVGGMLIDPPSIEDCVSSVPATATLIATSEADGYLAVSRGEPARMADGWTFERALELGAPAIKILVQQPLGSEELRRLDREFVLRAHDRCRELGLAIVLEVLVPDGEPARGASWVDALVASAAELSPYSDLYKTSFPEMGDEAEAGADACERLTAAAAVPWVVLSGGVAPELFERRLEVACRGGASGFLAGRSLFADCLAGDSPSRRARLREVAVPRLRRLGELTDRLVHPSSVAVAR